jgi:hypothetical protein
VSKATGWLDWDFDRAMRADCCAIMLAYEGKLDMLRAIYGSGEDDDDEELEPFQPGLLR